MKKEKIIDIGPMEIWKAARCFDGLISFPLGEPLVLKKCFGELEKKVLSFSLKCDFKRFVKCKEFCGFIRIS